jgi:two-component system response regulator AtoC
MLAARCPCRLSSGLKPLEGGPGVQSPQDYPELQKAETRVLVVEDDPSLCRILEAFLRQESYQAASCTAAPEALERLKQESFHLVLLDLALPPSNRVSEGLALMEQCLRSARHTKIVIITGEGTVETAMDCIRRGAEDYLVKPIDLAKLSVVFERALQRQKLEQWTESVQSERIENARLGKLLGQSFLMKRVYAKIRHAAGRDANVLILGESGTGKGLVAETIHDLSRRRNKPFVKVNCTALSEGLLESELFGHRKGSFTGAIQDRIGKFEFSNGGTLFLDEIGEIPPRIQSKLLHAVEDKEIQRIGGNQPIRVDIRIIAATNSNIRELMNKKRFRADLYYRLNTTMITIPPLRTRDRDIQLLADACMKELNHYRYKGFTLPAYEKLMQHNWPGNVRELRSVIYRAMGGAPEGGWIEPHHLEMDSDPEEGIQESGPRSLEESLTRYERLILLTALSRNRGNVSKTAKELRITRSGLHKKIIRLHIRKEEFACEALS